MLGCIGVAAPGDFAPTSGPAGSYGGNLVDRQEDCGTFADLVVVPARASRPPSTSSAWERRRASEYKLEPWAAHLLVAFQGKYDVITVAGFMGLKIPKKYLPAK